MKKLFRHSFASLVLISFVFVLFPSCDKIFNEPDMDNEPDTVGLKKGDTVWIYEIPESEKLTISFNFMAIGDNGDIYFGVSDADNEEAPRVYAITKNGKFKWKTEPLENKGLSQVLNSAVLVGDNGDIYCTSGAFLYSINSENGEINWSWECPETLPDENGNPVNSYSTLEGISLTDDGDLIVRNNGTILEFAGAIFCISPDGQLKWTYRRFGGDLASSVSIGPDGNIYCYATFWDNDASTYLGHLVVLNPDNGNLIWKKQKGSSDAVPVFTSDGDVITTLPSQDNFYRTARLNTESLQPEWVFLYNYSPSNFLVDKNDNVLLDFYNGGRIIIPDDVTGEITDLQPSPTYINFISINIDTKGNLVGTTHDYDPFLYSIDESGNVVQYSGPVHINLWTITLSDDNILYYSPTTDIYYGSNKVVALKWDASLEHSGWPRHTHDNRNTFNYNKW